MDHEEGKCTRVKGPLCLQVRGTKVPYKYMQVAIRYSNRTAATIITPKPPPTVLLKVSRHLICLPGKPGK